MPSVFDTLALWARKTSTSFGELRAAVREPESQAHPAGGLIYRLRHWPELPPSAKTADVYRALSVMSARPVNRRWFVACTRLEPRHADRLLERLVRAGDLEAIDPSGFPMDAASPESTRDSR